MKFTGVEHQSFRIEWPKDYNPSLLKETKNKKLHSKFESQAREERLKLLQQACNTYGISDLYFAHTLDDQLETMLMRLTTGSSIRGLGGMYYKSAFWKIKTPYDEQDNNHNDKDLMLVRPLLDFSKDELYATCVENNVKWFEDSTNTDTSLTVRNSIRYFLTKVDQEKIPVALQKPQLVSHLTEFQKRRSSVEEESRDLYLFLKEYGHFRFIERLGVVDFIESEHLTFLKPDVLALVLARLVSQIVPFSEASTGGYYFSQFYRVALKIKEGMLDRQSAQDTELAYQIDDNNNEQDEEQTKSNKRERKSSKYDNVPSRQLYYFKNLSVNDGYMSRSSKTRLKVVSRFSSCKLNWSLTKCYVYDPELKAVNSFYIWRIARQPPFSSEKVDLKLLSSSSSSLDSNSKIISAFPPTGSNALNLESLKTTKTSWSQWQLFDNRYWVRMRIFLHEEDLTSSSLIDTIYSRFNNSLTMRYAGYFKPNQKKSMFESTSDWDLIQALTISMIQVQPGVYYKNKIVGFPTLRWGLSGNKRLDDATKIITTINEKVGSDNNRKPMRILYNHIKDEMVYPKQSEITDIRLDKGLALIEIDCRFKRGSESLDLV